VASDTPNTAAISRPGRPCSDKACALRRAASSSLTGRPIVATSAAEPPSAAWRRSRLTCSARTPNSPATSTPGTPARVNATIARFRSPRSPTG
jgi:hypothetical protein